MTQSNTFAFAKADKEGKYIKHDPSMPVSYIPIGNISGVSRFMKPVPYYQEEKNININFHEFQPVQ